MIHSAGKRFFRGSLTKKWYLYLIDSSSFLTYDGIPTKCSGGDDGGLKTCIVHYLREKCVTKTSKRETV